MAAKNKHKNSPLVSVIVSTFNRPMYLACALASVLRQSYTNLQPIVVNDGGCDVAGVVNSFSDRRVVFINRKENRGKAASLNEALEKADGKYVAYLDDDDLFYPNHVETLVGALQEHPHCAAAYSDLYKVYCRTAPDGSRTALSKVVEVSRDFDRFVMLYFNNVLHVSLLHERGLIQKTGPYNENLSVLIDWDMTRRLAFFCDFIHIPEITGEFYQPVDDTERISFKQRRDKQAYTKNALTIRTTRPPKPWSKIKDLSIILLAGRLDRRTGATIGRIWRYTFYPYELYLPMPGADINRLNTDMPNVVTVDVDRSASQIERITAVLGRCRSEYVSVVPAGFPVGEMWLEDSLYALINDTVENEAFELEGSTGRLWAVVLKTEHLRCAIDTFPDLPLRPAIEAAKITLRRVRPDEIPFQFDSLLKKAQNAGKAGDWLGAARIYEYIAENYHNQFWMKSLAAAALFKAGRDDKAAEICHTVNLQRPTVDTLLLEAKLKRRQGDFHPAVELLEKAELILNPGFDCGRCEPTLANQNSQ